MKKFLARTGAIFGILMFLGVSLRDQEPTPTPEEEQHFRIMTAVALALREEMRNPDSFVLESALVIGDNEAVCYQYRGQNGFGGMSRGRAVLVGLDVVKTSERDGVEFTRTWNKRCANKPGREEVELIESTMSLCGDNEEGPIASCTH